MSSKAKSSDQPTISSFFPKTPAKKRGSTPVDLTVDSDDEEFSFEPPSKRTRLGDNNGRTDSQEERGPGISKFFTPVKGARSQKPPSRSILESPVSKYRFQGEESPQRADNDPNSTETELREKQARRDAFRNRLGDHFKPKSPKDLVVAESEVDYTRLDASGAETTEESENSEVEILEEPPAASRLQKFASTRSEPKSSSAMQTKGKGRSKKTEEIGPSGKKYTPLEKQVLACKEAHPDCLLLFEVGYKYKFFGEDATTASKELGIVAFPDRNFMSAMIPVTRKIVHVKRLISQGYKVGIIGQTETAAVKKAGDNRNAPFERKLVAMYTAATFIDDLNSVEDAHDGSPSSPPSIGCFVESQLGGMGADERVTIGMVSVVPSTGEVTYDEWQDGHMRTELETRITHLRPSELLVPVDLSKPTKKMLESVTGNKRFNAGTKIRVETFNETMAYSDAFTYLTAFYSRKQTSPGRQEDSAQPDDTMARVVGFPKKVIVALAHIIGYLKDFGIADTLLQASFFSTFATRTHMLLPSTTLNNLEIYRNSTDFSEKGSLFWILNRTTTKFGARLLKSWVGRPLVDP
ncbi:Mismatch repair protein msh3, partial [Tulasnella sp. 418]